MGRGLGERAIRVQTKEAKVTVYFVTIPSDFAKDLKLRKGDILHARIVEVEVEPGKRVRGVFFYKP